MSAKSFAIACLLIVGIAGSPLSVGRDGVAAPGKSTSKAESPASIDDVAIEIPAVPYLTLALIRDSSVHTELSLTREQVDRVQAAIATVDEPLWQLRDAPVKKVGAQLDELLTTLRQSLKQDLTSTQLARFDQILLQARGWKALVSTEISAKLKLSSDQVTRLRSTLAEATKDREALEKDLAGKPASAQEQGRAKLRKTEARRFSEVLTAKQQSDYTNLLGKPFDLGRVLQVGCVAPELRNVTSWINSKPLTLKGLRGKVVVVHFWAFGCINCIRNLPHYQGWQQKFARDGVVIIGIQTPETESERKLANLQRNVEERKIEYPVVFDEASENWKAWGNNMWPSVYLIDKQGRVRNWWYGELNWEGAKGEEFMSKRIEELVAEK